MDSEEQKKLRDAATVILTRDGEQGLEVFLMRRHREQAFMGGAFVFPGGALDPGDSDPDLLPWIDGASADDAVRSLQEPDLPPSRALGLYMAAIRETFEEAGVLLARDERGRPPACPDGEVETRFSAARQAVHKGHTTLKDLAARGHLRFALDLLIPYARWITPFVEKKRFDTRFFLARVPEGQIPLHDAVEMTESLWSNPASALAAYRSRGIRLMPPTLKTLTELCRFGNTTALFQYAKERRIAPILPQACSLNGMATVLLPHDPSYGIDGYRQPLRPDEPSRIVFRDKLWQLI